jgi:hypothetical protein
MKRVILIVAALGSLVFAGCAHRFSIIDPARPQVFVVQGRIVVNQEPVIVKRPGTITWTVPWGSDIRFAGDKGITVDAFVKPLPTPDGRPQPRPATPDTRRASLIKCVANKDNTEVSCNFTQEVQPGFYAYTVRVLADGKPVELDPSVMVE